MCEKYSVSEIVLVHANAKKYWFVLYYDKDSGPYFAAALITRIHKANENQVFDILLGGIVKNLYYWTLSLSYREHIILCTVFK